MQPFLTTFYKSFVLTSILLPWETTLLMNVAIKRYSLTSTSLPWRVDDTVGEPY